MSVSKRGSRSAAINMSGWHLIYVHTSIRVALAILLTPYVDRVYRENPDMGWQIHFPVLIWQGNAIRIEWIFVVFFKQFGSFRVIMGFLNPVSKKRIDSPRIKMACFSSFYVKIQLETVRDKIKNCQYCETCWLCFEILFLLSRSLSKVKVSVRWSRIDDARWTYGIVSVWNAPFWKVYISLGSANMEYWLCK